MITEHQLYVRDEVTKEPSVLLDSITESSTYALAPASTDDIAACIQYIKEHEYYTKDDVLKGISGLPRFSTVNPIVYIQPIIEYLINTGKVQIEVFEYEEPDLFDTAESAFEERKLLEVFKKFNANTENK